jgi:hypothetical protein
MFYVPSKQFFFFWSPNSFNSAQTNWDVDKTLLSDRWPTTFQSIWHPHSLSRALRNHILTLNSKSVIVENFFPTLGINSTRFLCGNCPLGFLFPINLYLWILQTGEISCVLHHHRRYTEYDDHISFSIMRWEWSKTEGSETTSSSVDFGIHSTRFFYVFFSGLMSFSNWLLSLKYWAADKFHVYKQYFNVFDTQ